MIRAKNTAESGLAISSKTKIVFPDVCARCGAQTHKTIPVKIKAGSPHHHNFEVISLLGTPGHIAGGINELLAGSTKIPCCRVCRRPYVVGYAVCIACIVGEGILCYLGPTYVNTVPEWLLMICIFLGLFLFIGIILASTIGQEIAAPVRIWRDASGYYYYFFSGAYRDWTQKQRAHPL